MKLTAQILAFYFLLGSLLPGSDFSQLKQASAVWQHYQLHRQLADNSEETVSLVNFIYEHFLYPDSHQHNDGGQSHQDLPLRSVHVFSQVIPTSIVTFQLFSPLVGYNQAITHPSLLLSAAHAGAIFRPPILS